MTSPLPGAVARRSGTLRRTCKQLYGVAWTLRRAKVWGLLSCGILLLLSCSPVRYVRIEACNPAAITFPQDTRRILIVNNAVPQQDVPFESSYRTAPDSLPIMSDSTTFDFCRALGEQIAEFSGFDDVRLLEDGYRRDFSPFTAPVLTRTEVGLLCDEHETNIVITLDRLLFTLNEYIDKTYPYQAMAMVEVKMDGVVRVYMPARDAPMATILLADTIIPDFIFEDEFDDIMGMISYADFNNLLRVSARFLAEEARIHFIPYWTEDIRWYYIASGSQWKQASAYAASDRWDRAAELWQTLYDSTTPAKQKARLASNLALCMEMTGDLNEALRYAERSHQLFLDHLDADDPIVMKQELYIRVLSNRITDEVKIRLQMNN